MIEAAPLNGKEPDFYPQWFQVIDSSGFVILTGRFSFSNIIIDKREDYPTNIPEKIKELMAAIDYERYCDNFDTARRYGEELKRLQTIRELLHKNS